MKFHQGRGLLLSYFKEQPRAYFIFFVLSVVIGLIDLMGITSLMPLVAFYLNGKTESSFIPEFIQPYLEGFSPLFLVGVFLGLLLTQLILHVFLDVYFVKKITIWRNDLCLKYIRAILEANFDKLRKLKPGEIEVVVTRNIAFSTKIRVRTAQLFSSLILSAIYLGMAVIISPATILLFGLIGGIFLVFNKITLFWRYKYMDLANKKYISSANIVSENVPDIRGLNVYNKENFLDKVRSELSLASLYVEKYTLAAIVMKHIHHPSLIFTVITGLIAAKNFTSIDNSAILFMLYVFFRAAPQISQTINGYSEVISDSPNDLSNEIRKWSKLKEENSHKAKVEGKNLDITISNGKIDYGDKPILKDINIEFKKGNHYCLIGESGIGKSTLLDVLCGFKTLTSGQYLIGGNDSSGLNLSQFIHDYVSIVRPEGILFSGTIAENIAYLEKEIDEKRVEELTEMTNIKSFLDPKLGIHTPLDPRGGNLSAGQKQRIIFARALYKKPRILLLDEPTSNLDSATERDILALIDKLKKDLLILSISHQPNLKLIADQVLEIKNFQLMVSNTKVPLENKNENLENNNKVERV